MALPTQPYKGARDFYPEEKRIQQYIFKIWRDVAASFGYQEYDASIVEPIDLYLAKTSQEIVNEQTYTFEDRGGRKVTLRPEMTPSVSRMVAARRQELSYPLRWFSIPNVWRYERPQRGRLREHWQLNVDLFGVAGLAAEHELILLADAVMQKFGAQRDMYTIRLNSRALVNTILHDHLQLTNEQALETIRLIDRKNKIDATAFATALEAIVKDKTTDLLQILQATNIESLPKTIKDSQAAADIHGLMVLLARSGITNAQFDSSLMRGFDYYTNIVFEVFDTDPQNNRSMFGGGRYDGLVGMFGVEPVPTVGFGMGDVTIKDFLEVHHLLPALPTSTDVTVVLVGDIYADAQDTIKQLRDAGVNVAVDATNRKIEKMIKSADKSGAAEVLFVGESELDSGVFMLKNLATGQSLSLTLPELINHFIATE